jgi:prophage regulatory protein
MSTQKVLRRERQERRLRRFLRLPEVEEVVGLKHATIYDEIGAGRFPKPVPIGKRAVAWLEDEITDWMNARIRERDAGTAVRPSPIASTKHYVVVSADGPPCPLCGAAMEVREHDRITDKHLRQPFYYRRWYRCMQINCATKLVMPEEHKVWNEARPSQANGPELELQPGADIVMDVLSER